jgi:hypothetical protein
MVDFLQCNVRMRRCTILAQDHAIIHISASVAQLRTQFAAYLPDISSHAHYLWFERHIAKNYAVWRRGAQASKHTSALAAARMAP